MASMNSGSCMGIISDDEFDFSEVSSHTPHTPTPTPARKRQRLDDQPVPNFPVSGFPELEACFPVSGFPEMEPNFPVAEFPEQKPYFPVSGFPAPIFMEAYPINGYKPGHTFDPNSSFYCPLHCSSTPCGGTTSCMPDFPVVRIAGLPFDCKESDILNFFEGLAVFDCLFVNNNAWFTGEAFVVFSSPIDALMALQQDCRNMGHRYVRVYACKKSDYYKAIAAEVNFAGHASANEQSPTPKPRDKLAQIEPIEDEEKSLVEMDSTDVLRLRGLPYSVTKADIIQFFGKDFGLMEADINFSWEFNGNSTGEAFIKFSSAKMAWEAMEQDIIIGERLVEVSASTRSDYYEAVPAEVKFGHLSLTEQSRPPEPQNKWIHKAQMENKKTLDGMHSTEELKLHGLPNSVTEVLELHGLPNSVTEADIVNPFREKFHLREDDTKTCFQFDEKASADAFVIFSSVDMARDAFSNYTWNCKNDELVDLEGQVLEDPQVLPGLINLSSMHPLSCEWPVSEDAAGTLEENVDERPKEGNAGESNQAETEAEGKQTEV